MERLDIFEDTPAPTAAQPAKKPVPRIRLDPRASRRKEPLAKQSGGSRPTTQIDAYAVYQLARIPCTAEEAAQFFGLTESAFKARLHREFELKLAWDRGMAQSKIRLRRLHWRHAEQPGDAGVKMTIHMSKHLLGEVEVQQVAHGGIPDNPIRIKVEREELIGRIVGNRTIEAGS